MSKLPHPLPNRKTLLCCLACAGAVVCIGTSAQTVKLLAHNASALPGGIATVDIDLDFAGPYKLLSLDLQVDYGNVLTWNQELSTFSWAGVTARLDATVAGLNAGGAAVLVTSNPATFAISSAFALSPPPLTGTATLHAAFALPQGMAPGTTSWMTVSARISDDDTGIEVPFSLPALVTAMPEPSAVWLMVAGLAGLAGLSRRRAAA
jgi:hypothetical protein